MQHGVETEQPRHAQCQLGLHEVFHLVKHNAFQGGTSILRVA
jgi:hypothetical protein